MVSQSKASNVSLKEGMSPSLEPQGMKLQEDKRCWDSEERGSLSTSLRRCRRAQQARVGGRAVRRLLRKAKNRRNQFLPLILGALTLLNGLHHAAALGWLALDPLAPLRGVKKVHTFPSAVSTIYLHNGVIEEEGPPDLVFGSPKSERLKQFLKSVS